MDRLRLGVREAVGLSRSGDAIQGKDGSVDDFYTETKTVYVDFSGGLQRAQIDNYADDI